MKTCLLIPKDAPHLCVQVDGEAKNSAPLVFREILPSGHPNRSKQLWIFDGPYIRLAMDPNMKIYGWGINGICCVHDGCFFAYQDLFEWKTIGDTIHRSLGFAPVGLGVPKGRLEAGSRLIAANNGEMCRFEFRQVEWNESKDVPKEPNSQENKANPAVEIETKPDLPGIASITANLSLLFGTNGSGQAGTCYTEVSLVNGYSGQNITISDELHEELCTAALKEGSILARKVKGRCEGNVGTLVDQSLQIPRHKQEMKLQLTIDLGSPCFVYQVRFVAKMQDGTTIEYYGGHFIAGDVIDLDDDDGATDDSHGEPTTPSIPEEDGKVETTVVPSSASEAIEEEKGEGHVVSNNAVDFKDNESAEESHCDSSEWDVVVE